MHWSDLDFDPPPRRLRQFAVIWLVFFSSIGALRALHGQRFAVPLLALGGLVGVAGLIRPQLARPFWIALTVLTFPIGWLVSRVLLGVIYFGVFTPVALVFRFIGRDALLRKRSDLESYWTDKKQPADPGRYLRQF
jgi:Saxitoxin biosynthesis operon protein SxtJ